MSRVAPILAEPVEATARRHLSTAIRAGVAASQDGKCESCSETLTSFEVDHRVPLALGGADQPHNWVALCEPCHKIKTRGDLTAIAKAKRRQAKHQGTFPPSRSQIRGRPFPRRGDAF